MYHDTSDEILVVDADDYFRELLVDVLYEYGFTARGAASGLDALGFLKHPPYPRLILLDLFTPRLNGWATMNALREGGLLGTVEVVGMTGLDVLPPPGMRRVLRKPFELHELMDAVGARPRQKRFPRPTERVALAVPS